MNKSKSIQIFFILFILSAAVYSPSLFNLNSFWDDEKFVFSNPYFLLAPSIFSFFDINTPFFKSWPIGYSFLWSIFKLIPSVNLLFFKLLNIFIHSCNAFLFYKIIKKYSADFALVFSILFLVHPQNVETVSWFFQFFILFATTFTLGSIWFFLKYIEEKKLKDLFLSAFLFLISLLTKPISIFLPILIFLHEPSKLKFNKKKITFLIICLIFSLAVGLITKNGNFVMLKNAKVQLHGFDENTNLNRQTITNSSTAKILNESNILLQSYHQIDKKSLSFEDSIIKLETYSIFKQAFYYYNVKLLYPFPLLFNFPKLNTTLFQIFLSSIIFLALPIFIYFRTRNLIYALFYPISFLIIMGPYLGFQYIPYFYWSNVSDRYTYLLTLVLPIFLSFIFKASHFSNNKIIGFFWGIIFFFIIINFQYGILFNSPLKLYKAISIENPKPEIYALLYEEQLKNNLFEDAKYTIKEAQFKYPHNQAIKDIVERHEILKNNYQN